MSAAEMEVDEQKRSEAGGAAGAICIQLLWCDKEVRYEAVTLFPLIILLTCTVLIGADLSTQSSCVNVKCIIVSWASVHHASLSCAL